MRLPVLSPYIFLRNKYFRYNFYFDRANNVILSILPIPRAYQLNTVHKSSHHRTYMIKYSSLLSTASAYAMLDFLAGNAKRSAKANALQTNQWYTYSPKSKGIQHHYIDET